MVLSHEEFLNEMDELIHSDPAINKLVESGGMCVLCGYDADPTILEIHHIAGKHNSDIGIPVCPNCHRILSRNQMGWDKAWVSNSNPSSKKIAFLLRGLADTLILIGKVLKAVSDRLLAVGWKR